MHNGRDRVRDGPGTRCTSAGLCLRLIDFVYHSTLGSRVIKEKKKRRNGPGTRCETRFNPGVPKSNSRVSSTHLSVRNGRDSVCIGPGTRCGTRSRGCPPAESPPAPTPAKPSFEPEINILAQNLGDHTKVLALNLSHYLQILRRNCHQHQHLQTMA